MRTTSKRNTPTNEPALTPNAATALSYYLDQAEDSLREAASQLIESGTKHYEEVHKRIRTYELVAAKSIIELASLARPAFKELADELGALIGNVNKLKSQEEFAIDPNPYGDMIVRNKKAEAAFFLGLKTLGQAFERIAGSVQKISNSLDKRGADVQLSSLSFCSPDEGYRDLDMSYGGGRDWTPS